ncbi:hypothetical protein F511_03477 [Dorcoceras hygrometricum]|uniref:Uncharacterized protein n=1 Tax=Dorcoceras hygrometricum TaxID=472368 RepID=A0A2Z7DHS3_9LAMI|nr:hypothetical protein F511_03477 [Dorcoceras hygrometricum]
MTVHDFARYKPFFLDLFLNILSRWFVLNLLVEQNLHLRCSLSWSALEFFWINAELWQCAHPSRIFPHQHGSIEADRVPSAYRFFLISIYGGLLKPVQPHIETTRMSQLTSQLVIQLVAQLSAPVI